MTSTNPPNPGPAQDEQNQTSSRGSPSSTTTSAESTPEPPNTAHQRVNLTKAQRAALENPAQVINSVPFNEVAAAIFAMGRRAEANFHQQRAATAVPIGFSPAAGPNIHIQNIMVVNRSGRRLRHAMSPATIRRCKRLSIPTTVAS
jgi:hypothetical protein